jgi:hypothetical protein
LTSHVVVGPALDRCYRGAMSTSRRVVVTGDDAALRFLAEQVLTPVDVIEDRDGWAITSPDIETSLSANEARDAGAIIVARLAGIVHLALGRTVALKAAHVVDVHVSGRRDVFAFAEGATAIAGAISPTVVIGRPQPDNPPLAVQSGQRDEPGPAELSESIATLAMRAGSIPPVALVLDLLGEPPTWPSLYKILDAIEEDLGGEKAVEQTEWVPPRDLKRFTRNANAIENARAGGRHAKTRFTIGDSADSMTIAEADRLMSKLVTAWLQTK